MISHEPAPYQHCLVPLLPKTHCAHAGIAFSDGYPYEVKLDDRGFFHVLSISMLSTRHHVVGSQEVALRMGLVGSYALHYPAWLDMGVGLNGEVRYHHKWDHVPSASEVDERLEVAFHLFKEHRDQLLRVAPDDPSTMVELYIPEFRRSADYLFDVCQSFDVADGDIVSDDHPTDAC